ncbi:aromatase/cyclase [Acidithiobacillus ferrivorans]|uniref:SRPBCC family protein n=1 Tax=Acidithiobacillus ferrivorans TaxID=160808 RepID=A0A7T4WG65_9PROT|nr:SRPBCC family protein [Acidithiobacillus ferrivorans]QQD74029.1 SRPBCC family protein [Acidithiobacillus ferrivorans]
MKTAHAVEVECSADAAFHACLNVNWWPEVFPPCLDAKVLEETDASQTIGLIAKANDQVFSWESKRRIDRVDRTIAFSQSKPSPLVRYMAGLWSITTKDDGCVITLTHEFSMRDDVAGLVDGVTDHEGAVSFMLRTVEENSAKELNAIKAELERDRWRHEFSEQIIIPHSKRAIYQLLRNLALWPWLLPHCKKIDMIYEDRWYQEFRMEVLVGEVTENIRSIRILSEDRIDYFQPVPPPALKEHRGHWTVTETDGGVEVVSWHSVVLDHLFWKEIPIDEAKLRVEMAINKNSLGTMQAIMNKLKGTQNARA